MSSFADSSSALPAVLEERCSVQKVANIRLTSLLAAAVLMADQIDYWLRRQGLKFLVNDSSDCERTSRTGAP